MNQETVERNTFNDHKQLDRPARIEPDDLVMVIDSNSKELIGHVLNFNESGMQLLMRQKIKLNQILQLTLVLNKAHIEKQYIKVNAELLWIKKEDDYLLGGFYHSSENFKSKFRLNNWLKSLL